MIRYDMIYDDKCIYIGACVYVNTCVLAYIGVFVRMRVNACTSQRQCIVYDCIYTFVCIKAGKNISYKIHQIYIKDAFYTYITNKIITHFWRNLCLYNCEVCYNRLK